MDPDIQLREKIISSIKGNKLFTDEDLAKLDDKIKKGQITEQDVLLFLENKIIKDSGMEKKK